MTTAERTVPFLALGGLFEQDDVAAAQRVIAAAAEENGNFFPLPEENDFQDALAKHEGAKKAIAVNACGTALDLCMMVLGIGAGDEVITTPLTFVCTATCASARGAKVIFADVDERTLCLDPKRLIPACSITPWSGERGLDELRRAAERGARMLVLHPMLQGFLPNDDLLDPLVAEAGRVNMPVYLHTGPHTGGSPAQALFLTLGHPGTRFILGHAGATDHSYDLPPLADQLPGNLWIELSFVRPWTLPGLLSRFGEDRLIFGSGFPRNPMPFELRQADSMLPVRPHPSIYRGNLLRVLGLMDSPFAMAGCSR